MEHTAFHRHPCIDELLCPMPPGPRPEFAEALQARAQNLMRLPCANSRRALCTHVLLPLLPLRIRRCLLPMPSRTSAQVHGKDITAAQPKRLYSSCAYDASSSPLRSLTYPLHAENPYFTSKALIYQQNGVCKQCYFQPGTCDTSTCDTCCCHVRADLDSVHTILQLAGTT